MLSRRWAATATPKEYMVEKFKPRRAHYHDLRRHLRDHGVDDRPHRWQLHLKTKGVLQRLGRATRNAGARTTTAAQPYGCPGHAPLPTSWSGRIDRLTRNQHILFRLGELIAFAETRCVFADRAINDPSDALPFSPETLQVMSRIHARDAALKIGGGRLRWAIGAGQSDPNLAGSLNLPAIYAAQAGLLRIWISSAKTRRGVPG